MSKFYWYNENMKTASVYDTINRDACQWRMEIQTFEVPTKCRLKEKKTLEYEMLVMLVIYIIFILNEHYIFTERTPLSMMKS